jgi:catechol 2,3-dioxygenase-like lactoylglutathione lyase family enzyme
MHAQQVVPILRVAEWDRAVAWYRTIGFEPDAEPHRFEPGLPAFGAVRNGDVALFLSEHEGDARPGTLVYLWVDEVDPVAAQFGVVPDDMPWARDIEVQDPDGNRIRIAQRT